jgi:hypothetical protein
LKHLIFAASLFDLQVKQLDQPIYHLNQSHKSRIATNQFSQLQFDLREQLILANFGQRDHMLILINICLFFAGYFAGQSLP